MSTCNFYETSKVYLFFQCFSRMGALHPSPGSLSLCSSPFQPCSSLRLTEHSPCCRPSLVSPVQFPSGMKVRGWRSAPVVKAADLRSLDLCGQVRVIIGDPRSILEGGLPKHLGVSASTRTLCLSPQALILPLQPRYPLTLHSHSVTKV